MDTLLSVKQTILSFLQTKKVKVKVTGQPTLLYNQVPLIFREEYIARGYRQVGQKWSYYAASLWQWHNETLNVWSHLVAAFYVFYQLIDLVVYNGALFNRTTWGLVALGTGALFCKLFSSMAHLFCSHTPYSHHLMYQIDYIGVSLNTQANGIFLFYMAGQEDFYRDFGSFYLFVNTILAMLVIVCCTISKLCFTRPFPVQRTLWNVVPCVASAFWHSIPLKYRLYKHLMDDQYTDNLLYYHYCVPFLFTLSTFFFASHIPERLVTGVFDNFMNSHTIFHVVISSATAMQFYVGRLELENRSEEMNTFSQLSLMNVFGWQAVLILIGIIVILSTHKYRLKNLERSKAQDHFKIN